MERGLLKATYAHPADRPPHRVGRSSKLYEPSSAAFEVSVPERRYDLLSEVLAEAVTSGGAEGVACDIAARRGTALGRYAPQGGSEPALATAVKVLARHGFEPTEDLETGTVWLRNCPFHDVAKQAPELVCRMNLAFVQGVLQGLEATGADAHLDPAPGRCCITLEENP